MTKLHEIDLLLISDNNKTIIKRDTRLKQYAELLTKRRFPLYGTFGKGVTRDVIQNFSLSEDAIDFIVHEIDANTAKAKIEWVNLAYTPDNFNNLVLSMAYTHDQDNVTELRYGFLQIKSTTTHHEYEINPNEYISEKFDFSVALRLLKQGMALRCKDWDYSKPKLIKLLSIDSVTLLDKTYPMENNILLIGKNYGGDNITIYSPDMNDILSLNWELCKEDNVPPLSNQMRPKVIHTEAIVDKK